MISNFLFSGGNSAMEKCDCGAMVNYIYFNPITKKKTCFVCSEKKQREKKEINND
jgi:hypothetical protein